MEYYHINLTWRKGLLLSLFFILTHTLSAQVPNIWINEIHYDNTGTDAGEAVEIVVEAFADFKSENISVHLYNGGNNRLDATHSLPQEAQGAIYDGFFVFTIETQGIQNGDPDGIALSYNGELIQFLSYGGSFTAEDGIAAGVTSVDILVKESGETPLGYSLQLTGTGDKYKAFAWMEASSATFGAPNHGQLLKVIDAPQPVTEFRVLAVAPDKVNLSWKKPIGVNGEDWSGVLIFGSDAGPNAIDLSGKNYSNFGGGENIFGEGSPLGESFTVARVDTDQDFAITVTGLQPEKVYHFVGYSGKVIIDVEDEFSDPSNEIKIEPAVAEVTNYVATPLNEKVRLSWSNLMGKHTEWWNEILVIASENPITSIPNRKIYSPANRFGEGESISPGEFVVFMGTDSVAFVEGLANNKDYYFKIFIRYDTEQDFYWSSGVETTVQPNPSVKYWSGSAGNNLFSDAANWQPIGVPDASHDVILDNSLVSDSYDIVSTGDDEILLNSLAILPENTSISIKLSSATRDLKKLTLLDNRTPLMISNNGVLINNITNSNGTIIIPNGEIVMEAGGKYVHNTGSGSTSILDRIKLTDGYIPGTIEFYTTGGLISLAGRTFQELTFASTSSATYLSAAGSASLTVKENLSIDESSTLNLGNISAPLYLEGDINIYGNLTLSEDLIFSGAGTQRLTGPLESPVQLNNVVVNKPDNNLQLTADIQIKERLEFIGGNIETGENKILLDYSNGDNPVIMGDPVNGKTIGNLEVIRNVTAEEVNFEYAGVTFKPGSEDLGVVKVIRSAGPHPELAGASAVLNRSWIISNSQPMSSPRDLIFTWDSDEENGLDLLNIQLWQESDIPDDWHPVGEPQDGTSRTLMASVEKFSQFVISDINNPLPITLLTFEVVQNHRAASLKWITINESNNAGFEIEKSIDGKQFYKIGFVTGSGTTLTKSNYVFDDNQFFEKAFYRLKQLDYDGNFTYSPIRFLSAMPNSQEYLVYPNPIHQNLTIKSATTAGNKTDVDFCHLINSLGEIIYQKEGGNLLQIEKELNLIFGDLQSGIYILKLAQNSKVTSFKLVKK